MNIILSGIKLQNYPRREGAAPLCFRTKRCIWRRKEREERRKRRRREGEERKKKRDERVKEKREKRKEAMVRGTTRREEEEEEEKKRRRREKEGEEEWAAAVAMAMVAAIGKEKKGRRGEEEKKKKRKGLQLAGALAAAVGKKKRKEEEKGLRRLWLVLLHLCFLHEETEEVQCIEEEKGRRGEDEKKKKRKKRKRWLWLQLWQLRQGKKKRKIRGVARPPAGAATHGQAACRGSRLRPGPPAKATDNQPARSSHQKVQPLVAWVAASRRNRPGAPAGVGSAYRVGTHGGAPFGDGTSPQGRRLRAQCQ
ncbi:hypothetical protein BHM03_00021713 [Ensete ventricosum]|nr:hypothetical protein BHM03_00021713 [Ensete ventricosum]